MSDFADATPTQPQHTPDLEPDVERLHRPILREPGDPEEGHERVPWWLWAVATLALFWGGWYLGRTGGRFDTSTHLAYARDGAASADGAAAGAPNAGTAVNPAVRGKQVYTQNCQSCHQPNGGGLTGVFPPLVGSSWVTGAEETVVRILLNGLQGPVVVAGASYNGLMPAWRDPLSDDDLAAVATYIRQWAPNAASAVSASTVAGLRTATASRTTPWTAAELEAAASSPAESSSAPSSPAAQERRP